MLQLILWKIYSFNRILEWSVDYFFLSVHRHLFLISGMQGRSFPKTMFREIVLKVKVIFLTYNLVEVLHQSLFWNHTNNDFSLSIVLWNKLYNVKGVHTVLNKNYLFHRLTVIVFTLLNMADHSRSVTTCLNFNQ